MRPDIELALQDGLRDDRPDDDLVANLVAVMVVPTRGP